MSRHRHAIVLAAGAATRFGGGKLTARWRDEPLIVWAVHAALSARVESVVVVLGARADDVRGALVGIADDRLRWIEAPDWSQGLSASLRAGLDALPPDAAVVAVFLGDMPAVDAALADRLLDAVEAGAPAARARSPFGPAHPTAFAARTFAALRDVVGDQGGREVLRSLGDAVAMLDTAHPGAIYDIDRPEDLNGGPASEDARPSPRPGAG